MASGDTITGVGILVKIGGTAIGGQRDAKLRLGSNLIDATHKGSGSWKRTLAGIRDYSVQADCLVVESDAQQAALITAFLSATQATVSVTFYMPWGETFSGTCQIGSLEWGAPYNEMATFVASFDGNSALAHS